MYKFNNMYKLLCIASLIMTGLLIIKLMKTKKKEGYNDEVGQLCTTCGNKTPNQCSQCFNCGFCVDSSGNSTCIGGDHTGPYNFERCKAWYHVDPFHYMLQKNRCAQNRKKKRCSYSYVPNASSIATGS